MPYSDLWTIVSDVESKLPEELGNIKASYDVPSTDENGDAGRGHDVGMDSISSNHMGGDMVMTINSQLQEDPFTNVFHASQNANQVPSDGLSSASSNLAAAQQQQHLMRQPLQQQQILAAQQQRQLLNSSQPQLVTILPPSSVSLSGPLQRFQIHMSSNNNQTGSRMLQLPLVLNNSNTLLNANTLITNNTSDMNNFATVCGVNQQVNVQPVGQNRQNVMTIMVPGRSGNTVSLPSQIMLNGNIMTANQGSWSNSNTPNGNNVQHQIVGSTPSLVVMDNNNSQTRLVTVPPRLSGVQKLVLISSVGNATSNNNNNMSVSNSSNFLHNQTNMIGHALVDSAGVGSVSRVKNYTFSTTQQQNQQPQQTIQQQNQQQQPILNINNIASVSLQF